MDAAASATRWRVSLGPPPPPPQWPAPAAPHRPTPCYWYAIGAALIAIGLIGGIGLFVTGLVYALKEPTSQLDANGSATAQFASGDSMIIYVADVEPVPKLTQNTRCVAARRTTTPVLLLLDDKEGLCPVSTFSCS